MTRQLTVRLPDDLVEFIDHRVQHGEATSRVALALRQYAQDEADRKDPGLMGP
ncbi:MAG: ribbon-helix-helix domain-containing protein [Acidimicrobiales bacterium]